MKKLLMVLLLSVVFIPFVHAGASKPIEMKLGHFAADAHPGNLASKMFAEAVEKRTNGAIKVTIYPNNALGAPPEVLEQNILGAVAMSLPTQAAMEALGAVVATINFNELQMALKQGVVDGQENPIAVIYSNKIYETQKYLAITGHNYNSMVHVISKKVWDKLTAAQKKIVREESKKAGNWMRKAVRDAEADQISQLKGFGMEVTYPDKKEFKKLMKPAYDRMKAIAGEENIAAFIKMVDEAK